MSKMIPTLTGTSSEEKYDDLLFDFVFPNLKILLFQATDGTISGRFRYGRIDQYQIDVHIEAVNFGNFVLGGRDTRQGHEKQRNACKYSFLSHRQSP